MACGQGESEGPAVGRSLVLHRKSGSTRVAAQEPQALAGGLQKVQEGLKMSRTADGVWASPGGSVATMIPPTHSRRTSLEDVFTQAALGAQEGPGRATCTHHHDLVLLLAAVLGQDGQDGRGQQDALQHVDHTIGSQNIHSPQQNPLRSQQDAPLWQSPVCNPPKPGRIGLAPAATPTSAAQ